MEKVALYLPEGVWLDQPQGRQERHPHNVCGDTIRIVQYHKAASEYGFRDDVNPPETHFELSALALTVWFI